MGTIFHQHFIVDICRCQKTITKPLVDARKKIGGTLEDVKNAIFRLLPTLNTEYFTDDITSPEWRSGLRRQSTFCRNLEVRIPPQPELFFPLNSSKLF